MSRASFASRLDDAMHVGRIATATLAEKMGVSRQTVNNWRKGKGEPSDLDRVAKLADILRVPAGWLATGVDESATPPSSRGRIPVPGRGTRTIPEKNARAHARYEALQDRVVSAEFVLDQMEEALREQRQLVRDLRQDLRLDEEGLEAVRNEPSQDAEPMGEVSDRTEAVKSDRSGGETAVPPETTRPVEAQQKVQASKDLSKAKARAAGEITPKASPRPHRKQA